MKLEPANIVCPKCGNPNYMRHLIGWNVGHLDMKCINCNSYFNFDELCGQKIEKTNGDRIRSMSDEELAEFLDTVNNCTCSFAMGKSPCDANDCPCWLYWLKQEVKDEKSNTQEYLNRWGVAP